MGVRPLGSRTDNQKKEEMITKELRDHIWKHCLPKEFKEEVKVAYTRLTSSKYLEDSFSRGMKAQLETLFCYHNLTSDAEEEEMLTVSRKKVQGLYKNANEGQYDQTISSETRTWCNGQAQLLVSLFGSKCLPDEDVREVNFTKTDANEDNFTSKEEKPSEPKFHVGQIVKLKDKGYGFEVTAVKKRDDCHEYKYKLAGWRHPFRESDLEPCTEP